MIETGNDPVFPGTGPDVYWNFLFGAYIFVEYGPAIQSAVTKRVPVIDRSIPSCASLSFATTRFRHVPRGLRVRRSIFSQLITIKASAIYYLIDSTLTIYDLCLLEFENLQFVGEKGRYNETETKAKRYGGTGRIGKQENTPPNPELEQDRGYGTSRMWTLHYNSLRDQRILLQHTNPVPLHLIQCTSAFLNQLHVRYPATTIPSSHVHRSARVPT